MKLLITWLLAALSLTVHAQTTSNLINPAGTAWGIPGNQVMGISGITAVEGGGPTTGSAYYNSETNTIRFGYNSSTVAQTIAINQALSGTGIQVGGFSWNYQWMNGGYSSGTLQSNISMTSSTGAVLQSRNFVHGVQATTDWQTESGTHTFNAYPLSSLGNLSMSFTGQDDRFWMGLYGPRVRNVSLGLSYSVDPCALNPLSSPSCSGFNDILTSQNILSQSYAINSALNLSGSGVLLHGYRYGYTVTLGESWYGCTATNQDGSCSWYMSTYPAASVSTSVRNNTNTLIRPADTQTYSGTNSVNAYDFSVMFDSSRTIGTMGTFTMGVGTSGNASVTNKWSNWQYTPDPCVGNPLYSSSCEGYATAYFNQQCTISALYNTACPGYAAAYFTQQCTVSALYNPACPGYAEAYFAYQCNLDAFYSQSCPKYAEAYAKKNILNIGSTTTSTSASISTPTTTVRSDGTVNTEVSRTGDSTIDSAITAPSTTSTTGVTSVTNTTGPVSQSSAPVSTTAAQPQSPAQPQSGPGQSAQETRRGDGETRSAAGGSSNNATAKSNVEARAREVARASAGAATFEAQTAVQGTVVALMGFVPGFDAYGTARITDVNGLQMARQYGRATVDNRAALRGLTGASDRLHSDMVDQQYQRGK
jgi:hypothetical protein